MSKYCCMLLLLLQLINIWLNVKAQKIFFPCGIDTKVKSETDDCQYCIWDKETCDLNDTCRNSNYTRNSKKIGAVRKQRKISGKLNLKFNDQTNNITWSHGQEKVDDVTITFYRWSESNVPGEPLRGCCGVPLKLKSCKIEQCEDDSLIFWSITVNGERRANNVAAFKIERCNGEKREEKTQFFCPENDTQSAEPTCLKWDFEKGRFVGVVKIYEPTSAREYAKLQFGHLFRKVCSFYMEKDIVSRVGAEMDEWNVGYFESYFKVPLRTLNVSKNGTNVIIMHGAQPSGLSVMCETKDFFSEIESGLNFTNEADQTMCFFTYTKLDASVAPVRTYCAVTKEKPTPTPELTTPTSWLLPIVWCGSFILLLVCVIILYRLTKKYKRFIESTKVINLSLEFDENAMQSMSRPELFDREEAVALTEEEKNNFFMAQNTKELETKAELPSTQEEISNVSVARGYISRDGDVIVSSNDDQSGDSGISSVALPTTSPETVVFSYQLSSDSGNSSSMDPVESSIYENSDRRLQSDADDSGRPLSALESHDSNDRCSRNVDVFTVTEFSPAASETVEPVVTEEEIQICQRLFGFSKEQQLLSPVGEQAVGTDMFFPKISGYIQK